MYADKKTKQRVELPHRLGLGLGLLNFNQSLIQFADSKANGLVLVNSIFLASMAPAVDTLKRPTTSNAVKAVALVFFAVSVLALLASLWVTLARAPQSNEPRPKSLAYYKHILSFHSAQGYVDEFRESEGEHALDALLVATHDLAGIASAKFKAYKGAERLTLCGAVLWISSMIAVQLL
jgi:hypothetical protein